MTESKYGCYNYIMKKIVLFILIALLISGFCFAQNAQQQTRALQGTWLLIAIMNDEDSFTEADLKAENVIVTYSFKGNEVTIINQGEVVGPVSFQPEGGYLKLTGERVFFLPYNLQGNILIIHESEYAYIYRKGK